MRRREFIAGLGSAAVWPLAARAQQDERMRRVGVLMEGATKTTAKALELAVAPPILLRADKVIE